MPYVIALTDQGVVKALQRDRVLARGLNTHKGEITHPAVGAALERPAISLALALAS